MSCFLEFSDLRPNETVKSSIVTLYITFERILKDFKMSYLAKTQVLQIAFAQVPTISQLYKNNLPPFPVKCPLDQRYKLSYGKSYKINGRLFLKIY